MSSALSRVRELRCFNCKSVHPFPALHNLCVRCGKPLRVDYDLPKIRPEDLPKRKDLWRYAPVLPYPYEPLSLGEGGTPLIEAHHLSRRGAQVWIKDEAVNPTGSFKARGMAVAIPMAKMLGVTKVAVPSAGNAGGALAHYAARYGLEAHVFMPSDTPAANVLECHMAGAHVTLVDGLISDCGRLIAEQAPTKGWFELSTLKEPYRIEGKKTMGYELAEQFVFDLPDVIVYPTGGGTGLIGMGKAFDEMESLGWIGRRRPRMVSVQAEGCAPIPRAFASGLRNAALFENASTVASGLRVPRAIGDFIMLDLIRRTHGTARTVSDAELMAGAYEITSKTGVSAAPEGGACLALMHKLEQEGWIRENERVVLFNTGTGVKYAEAFRAFPRS